MIYNMDLIDEERLEEWAEGKITDEELTFAEVTELFDRVKLAVAKKLAPTPGTFMAPGRLQ